MEETVGAASLLNNVVLHDVTTGRALLPNVQFVYQGEEVAPQVLQRAWLTVHLHHDGRVAQINSTQPDARVNAFHVSNDEETGETLHVEGFFPFDVPETSGHHAKTSYELLQEFQQRSSFIRSLLVEAVDEGLFTPHEHGTEEELLQQQQRLSADGIADGFLHVLDQQHLIPSLRPLSPLPSPSILTGLGSLAAAPSSILSPQPHSKQQQQQLLDQSPLIEHGSGRLVNRPQLQLSPDFNIGRTGSGEEGDEYDLARSEAERGQLKDIVLKFHRNRHALLSPPQEDDDLTSLMLSGTSANNRNRAPSPYPYGGARDELVGSGGAIGLAGDITMSPTPREAPKVCLSPYKRANLVYSGQHIHSSVSSSSSSSSSTPSSSSSSVPTRKALFNSGDALGAPSRHGIELGLLPSSSSPPLPMQREIVDKVKVALDEAMQSVKTRIIEEQLFNWAQPPPPNTRRNHYPTTQHYSYASQQRPEVAPSPTSMLGSQSLDQRYEETRGTEQVLSGRQMLRSSSSGVDQQYPLAKPSSAPPHALASSPTASPPFVPRDYH